MSSLFIRATHPAGFRSGQWGKVIGLILRQEDERPCYRVEFIDNVVDLWPVYDASDPYEFSSVVTV